MIKNKHKALNLDNQWIVGSIIEIDDYTLIKGDNMPCNYFNHKQGNIEFQVEIVDSDTVGEYIYVNDSNNIGIFCGDIIEFYMCYKTYFEYDVGDRINHSEDEPQLIKLRGKVYYDADMASYSVSIISDYPYGLYDYLKSIIPHEYINIPIIRRGFYDIDYIKYVMNYDFYENEEEWLSDLGFKSIDEMMSKINTITIVDNICSTLEKYNFKSI